MPEEDEQDKLGKVIRQWNNNRLDLFEISQPDENLEFHGVMRFYLEDPAEGNVATKCLRVCSNSVTREIIDMLSEKFRPDMKMLTTSYALYEIHNNKEERKLDLNERPLVVQLNWNSANREGRFVLKKDKDSVEEKFEEKEKGGFIQNFKRTLSRKGKKKERNSNTDDKASEDENGPAESSLNNDSICLSNLDAQKYCTEKKRPQRQAAADQAGLPIAIQFSDNFAEPFLCAVINYTNSSTVHFKLSPAYVLYAACRFVLQRRYGQDSRTSERADSVTSISNKMVSMTGKVIQRQQTIGGALAFWMANSSELLNFLKHDQDLSPLTQQSQLDLSHLVHKAYSCLLQCLQNELRKHLPTFLIDPEQYGSLPAGIGAEMVLNTLMNTMSLLRRCQVNHALTIQLFSQLFHYISVWLFNQLMSPEASTPGLRSHYWGAALRQRLTAIEAWAERQGLELAADCHLGHIIQATTLLTMNKYSMQDAKDIQTTCFKLNSLQLHMLLAGYLYATNEPHIPPDLINAVVTAAQASADNLIRSEGQDIQLQESLDLHLPFLLPEGGYSCETVRGIPQGFREFLEPMCQKGLCSLTPQPNSKGDWTIYFSESAPSVESTYLAAHRQPEIMTITLNKPLNSGMGVSIVAAKGAGQCTLGIYIKSIVKGGPAEMNGQLTAGDQLLSVDGQSLVGLSQERAAAIMMQTGPIVTLQVAKFAASYHGLEALLRESTPEKTTGERDHAMPNNKACIKYSTEDHSPSEELHGGSRRKKQQIMQRNRQFYRSNPNMAADFCLEDGDKLVDPFTGNSTASVSTKNLCSDKFHWEYLTLPNPRSQDRNVSEPSKPQQTFQVSLKPLAGQSSYRSLNVMRQALSQENLCTDSGRPLLDKSQSKWTQKDQGAKQTENYYTSFPIRSCLSTHDILSDNSSPTNQQQVSRVSCAGVWRTPFSQHSTSTPSIQPIRIDIPLTRAASHQSNPPLTTFQQSSSSLAVKMSRAFQINGHKQNPQSQASSTSACPVSPTKKLLQPSLLSQKFNMHRDQAAKPQVSITPTKHVSFQEPPCLQKKSGGPMKQKDPMEMSDPWKREAQEKLEKQLRLEAVEFLQQEMQELQAKAKRTAEENDRLRKLNLEWQFQKRLQEIQQRGDDEDEDKDLDMMVMIQQLENSMSQAKNNTRSSGGKDKTEKQTGIHLSKKEDEEKRAQRLSGLAHDVHQAASKENQEEKMKRASAPEKLTFKERQRLFSLASSS
ncbi:afadin isoform X1 [Neolamprologus brichardi]|uniref:afadin isoform X1 n=1 Tax=Neolamprologus brichardi TaxID=32507 RepID=UPI0003EBFBC0|nr:afadin isoform X1 [Neolamprologus brichardi]XP_035767018.1 afadin isoform X1 [Neolamprologus brichardi]